VKTQEQNNYFWMNERFKHFKLRVDNVTLSGQELQSISLVLSSIYLMTQKRELLVEIMLQVDDASFIRLCELIDKKELDKIMPSC
jgi:hypothetical protein